jgi:hypothetical protein
MIFIICLFIAVSSNAKAENYFGNLGSEVVSDFDPSNFHTPINLNWNGDAFDGVPGFSNPHPIASEESTLQATMPGDPTSLAVVNDKVVAVGEKVNGKKVRKIGANYVLLEKGGSVQELNLDDKPATLVPVAAAASKSTNRSPASQLAAPSLPEGIINIQERLVK